MIKRTFSQNVYSFFQATVDTVQNFIFFRNNWIKVPSFGFHNSCFDSLNSKNIAIWLSSRGEFCYRTDPWSVNIHTIPLRNADIVLSNLLGFEIQIITKSKHIKVPQKPLKVDTAPIQEATNFTGMFQIAKIHITELLRVEQDIFSPLEPKEFFSPNVLIPNHYRNTFLPSYYLQLQHLQDHKWYYSVTLQYIYYLANYQQDRFYFIMNWLAAFFKNLNNRSQTTLVFLGNKESGKEILFDEIIKPLFGHEYCLKINDNTLETTSIQKLLKNKLFCSIDNLSDTTIKDKKTKNTFNDLLSKNTITVIENKESIIEYPKYCQTIITLDEARLPSYMDKDFESYSLFKIPDEYSLVENFNLKQKPSGLPSLDENVNIKTFEDYLSNLHLTSKAKIIEAIRNDLTNFAYILKGYKIKEETLYAPFENDDKKYLQSNLEDKLRAFHEAILKYKTSTYYFQKIQKKHHALYEEVINDFSSNTIKQKNLITCFSILYPEENMTSSRTLMVHLRKIDSFFYSQKNFKIGTAGVKYLKIKNYRF